MYGTWYATVGPSVTWQGYSAKGKVVVKAVSVVTFAVQTNLKL